ncbi:MAG: translation elongation factor Ts [Candidatus Yanofskybacteria bacterium RIFCSPHIGHO2_02_FULL_41_11]|uniref:Elongation factor Ts n=1 Tax=Candidatus Yanofskybacteria bacterium RIFCSPHIGHO2_02_FULL_41_11 TaxID=1802675 RepID=A0A1F8FB59_9BACT|nr:MAG: translation elongation factor Ts [Candidatus Yanofskybacteria bacterium RIFCSPHIGHO2_02_FULL_41_11]
MNSENIKKIRDLTGLSFNEIRKALEEAADDVQKALENLKAKGAMIADKKSSRQLKDGIVDAYIHSTRKVGCILELLCETDFVARNEEFRGLAHELAMHITAMKPQNVDDLLGQDYVKDPSRTVKDFINQHVAKLGENIQVGRFEIFEI